MSPGRILGVLIAICILALRAVAQEQSAAPTTAEECLDRFFLNCDTLTGNACELVSGSMTETKDKEVRTLDFVWFRAQKVETRQRVLTFLEGRCMDPVRNDPDLVWERKLMVGDTGYYGAGSEARLDPIDLVARLPTGKAEADREKKRRLTYSKYRFPELCPTTVLAAVDVNSKHCSLAIAQDVFGRMTCIDQFSTQAAFVGTWRLDSKATPGRCCVKISFDKRQGYMPTYVEWRLRDLKTKSDLNKPDSYGTTFSRTESQWSLVHKEKQLWGPHQIVNKSTGQPSMEWFIEVTWKYNALKNEFFDPAKLNLDRDNALSKIRQQMQNSAPRAARG